MGTCGRGQSTPANPFEVGYCRRPRFAKGVAVSGAYAYAVGDSLSIISIADPANPEQVGSTRVSGTGVAVNGLYAFVANMNSRLKVFRIADPARPIDVWAGPAGADGMGLALGEGFVCVAAFDDGLRVYSGADPAHPVELGYYDEPGIAWGVAVAGGFFHLAYDWQGLQIFQYYGPGIAEGRKPQAASFQPLTTIVRKLPAGMVAFDATGRRVQNPKPGIYFVRQASSMMHDASCVTKVLVTR